jgi:uncharacterized protein YrrD
MSLLMRASAIVGRPVVTLGGDDLAEVRDVVFDPRAGRVLGFTLNGRGFLSGRRKEVLPWPRVSALGPDAVMVADEEALRADDELVEPAGGGDVLGSRVLTDTGTDLGRVADVVVEANPDADVVGYEIEPSAALSSRKGRTLFLPLPDTLSVSAEALVVPAAAADYVQDDLAGFGGAVEAFRTRLRDDR